MDNANNNGEKLKFLCTRESMLVAIWPTAKSKQRDKEATNIKRNPVNLHR
ncbi:hypothetical protein JCM19240_1647 [Vibrio maritimus]|uniref:Uncharacterized protein n=1 Tax=Vibrio maritimus TaxID=990268 RepID=A0A090T894_9VIBR|nr:hypothetical protein JCM19240_1647 [Vibrio maritimus]